MDVGARACRAENREFAAQRAHAVCDVLEADATLGVGASDPVVGCVDNNGVRSAEHADRDCVGLCVQGSVLDCFADHAVCGCLDRCREAAVGDCFDVDPDRGELGELFDGVGEPRACERGGEEAVRDRPYRGQCTGKRSLGVSQRLYNDGIGVWPELGPRQPQARTASLASTIRECDWRSSISRARASA